MPKKPKADAIGLIVRCESTENWIQIPFYKLRFDADVAECDLCGSHGRIILEFDCKCENSHSIVLKDW